jgi:hypothetical protein
VSYTRDEVANAILIKEDRQGTAVCHRGSLLCFFDGVFFLLSTFDGLGVDGIVSALPGIAATLECRAGLGALADGRGIDIWNQHEFPGCCDMDCSGDSLRRAGEMICKGQRRWRGKLC